MGGIYSNFGHVLYDLLAPIFNMLQLLGLYTPDFQLVFAALQVPAPAFLLQAAFGMVEPCPSRSAAPLVS